MPRTLLPSPNEEAFILQKAKLKQKRERIIAARNQSTEWCKRRTTDHLTQLRTQNLNDKLQETKTKIKGLNDKENLLKNQLASALSSLGQGNSDANKINDLEMDKKRAMSLAEFSIKAAERHKAAMTLLAAAKANKSKKETQFIELKKDSRKKEDELTKRLLENPSKNRQPLAEIPKTIVNRPLLSGLDAFNQTYYHLPTDVGVVDEMSMKDGGSKNAKALAEEVEQMMNDCRLRLQGSKQAREERADVRGTAALQKVQLKNVLEDVTSQLDKYSVYSRTKKKASTLHTNVFASNLARENTQKQHQVDLEHAVEDIFDRHNAVNDMVLPSSHKFETTVPENLLETIDERSEVESVLSVLSAGLSPNDSEVSKLINSNGTSEVVELGNIEIKDISSDELADASRPSLNLYFPLHSDVSSEGHVTKSRDSHETTSCDSHEKEFINPLEADPLEQSCCLSDMSSLQDSRINESAESETKMEISKGIDDPLDLSRIIKDQFEINAELRLLSKPLNTTIEEDDTSSSHPPPISYTSPCSSNANTSSSSAKTSSSVKSSSFEEIIQELLTPHPGSDQSLNSVDSSAKLSDSISQRTLSRNSSVQFQKLTPGSGENEARDIKSSYDLSLDKSRDLSLDKSRDLSVGKLRDLSIEKDQESPLDMKSRSNNSALSSASTVSSGISVPSGISELRNQLLRINSHLGEIEKIKEIDAVFYK